MSKKLIVEVGFTTDPMGEISHFELEFSDADLNQIRKHQAYLRDNPDVFKVVINFDAEYFADEEGTPSDFRADSGELFIFKETVYYYTQSRYDASSQYESQAITNDELWGDEESIPYMPSPVDQARQLLADKGFFTENLWTTDDVIETGSNMGHEITEEQAKEIFGIMGKRHDAEQGINWDFIQFCIEEYFEDQE